MSEKLYLAPATRSRSAYDYFNRTVLTGISREFYSDYITKKYGNKARIWGLTSSFDGTWTKIEEGDLILFYTRQNEYEYALQVEGKDRNPDLGDAIRDELLEIEENENRDWNLLLFLSNPVSVSITGEQVAQLLDYNNKFPVRFIRVIEDRMNLIKKEYGSIGNFIDDIKI